MNGDLISRSALIQSLRCNVLVDVTPNLEQAIEEQPTAYDVDKVVEQLEQQKNQYFRRAEEIKNKFGENYESQKNYGKACSYDHAIEIVKSSGIE